MMLLQLKKTAITEIASDILFTYLSLKLLNIKDFLYSWSLTQRSVSEQACSILSCNKVASHQVSCIPSNWAMWPVSKFLLVKIVVPSLVTFVTFVTFSLLVWYPTEWKEKIVLIKLLYAVIVFYLLIYALGLSYCDDWLLWLDKINVMWDI